MDTVQNLMLGFSVAMTPENLIFALLGCLWGTLLGVLPGIGATSGMAILMPFTFHLPPATGIIMLAAIYYGNQYGGTTTSILLNVPGEASNAVSCLDGYPMAKQGRAGVALSVAAVGSFIGGSVSILALILVAQPLTRIALEFGPVEFFALLVLGICLITALAGKSMIKGLMMGACGLLIAMVGTDPALGSARFTFGRTELMEGTGFVPVIMGLFGMSEILQNAEVKWKATLTSSVGTLWPTRQDVKDSLWPVVRGSLFGLAVGLIPGMTTSASAFMAYALERKVSKYPERFGTGVIEGIAGPETANNAHANAALVPLFTLGLPGSASIALLMGGFMIFGLAPGPFLFKNNPDVAWGVIASMIIGNVMLLVLNLPLIGMWVKILELPYSILFAVILGFMMLGVYSIDNSGFDVLVMLMFGVAGYFLRKLDFPLPPAILTFVLGRMMEKSLRRSLEMSQGDFGILLESPISTATLAVAALVVLMPLLGFLRRAVDTVRGGGGED